MENKTKNKMYLTAEMILKYLMGDDKLHTIITTKNTEFELVTTDQSLYEALGSVENRNEINLNLLVKLLEVTTVMPFQEMMKQERKILTNERVDDLRNKLKEKNESQK